MLLVRFRPACISFALVAVLWLTRTFAVQAFVSPAQGKRAGSMTSTSTALKAAAGGGTSTGRKKPQRLDENVSGVVYVNDRCINCAACSAFSPQSFVRASRAAHVVYHQPENEHEIQAAREALAACPVAAIRVESKAEKKQRAGRENVAWTDHDEHLVKHMSMSSKVSGRPKPFPKPFFDIDNPRVYWVGHHNEGSFGGVPFLVQARHEGRDVWVMVDSPRFDKSSVEAITSITGPAGPDYLFLSHVDDTADHGKWGDEFPNLQQIFHAGDLGRHNWIGDATLEQVEVLLQPATPSANNAVGLTAYSLDGQVLEDGKPAADSDIMVLHTPGHSPGSISLYMPRTMDRPGLLFTGDTLGYTTSGGGHMSSFSRYGNNHGVQHDTLTKLFALDWDVVAPGHGHARDYRNVGKSEKAAELQEALDELIVKQRR